MANQKIRGITIELNADTAGIMDGLKEINSSLAATTKSLNDVNKLLKIDPENVTLLAQKQEYLTKAIEDTQAKLEKEKELLESMKSADNADQTIEQQKALEREIEATTQKLTGYQTQLEQTDKALDGMGESSQEAAKGMDKTADAVMMLAQSEAFSKIAEGAKELYEALMQCDNAADQFETAMAKVETLAHKGNGLGAIADEIKSYSASLGVSAKDFAEGVYQAMSAGVAADEAVKFTSEMTKLAIGGFTDSATAVDIVTTALNAYGLATDEATHIMDNLIATQNLGKTTVDELATAMGRVIPTASAYSVNIDNLSAAYAELTAKGIKTRITTTDLNAMFQELGDSEKEVNKILTELTGQTFGQFMERGGSLGDIMGMLWEYANKDKEAFYGLWAQSSAATAAFNLASDGGARFNEILAEMQNNAGLAEENFQIMAETSEMLDARFSAAMENLQIAIGDALGPALDSIKEKGLEALEPITEFIEKNPELVTAIAGMIAGVVGVTTAVTACAAAVSILKLALGDITTIATVLGSAAVIGGIVGLSAAIEETSVTAGGLKHNIDSIKKTMDETTSSFGGNITNIKSLAETIRSLNSEEELNAEQQLELASAVQQWNEVMDDNNQLILDNTGHVIDNTGALVDNLEVALQAYELAQKQEELTQIVEQYAEAQDALTYANELRAEAEEKLADAIARGEEMNMTGYEAVTLAKEVQTEAQAVVDELASRYETLTNEVKGATEATDEHSDATEGMTATEKAALEELAEAYDKNYESIRGALKEAQFDMDEYKKSTVQSVDEMAEDMKKQAENMRDYANLVAEAYEIMQQDPSASGLLSSIISQGPEAAGQLQNLVDAFNGTEETLASFNEVVAAFNDQQGLLDAIAQMQDGIKTGYEEPINEALEFLGENLPAITDTMNEAYNQQQEDAETNRSTMTDTARGTVVDMTAAVTEEAPKLADAEKKALEEATKQAKAAIGYSDETGRSTMFYELGRNIDQSIADGVTENASVIAEALQNALDSAVSGLSLSGLSGVINRAMGEALG